MTQTQINKLPRAYVGERIKHGWYVRLNETKPWEEADVVVGDKVTNNPGDCYSYVENVRRRYPRTKRKCIL